MAVMRVSLLAILVVVFGQGVARAEPPEKQKESEKSTTAADSPERAFKEFVLAMMCGEESRLKATMLPAEGMEVLVRPNPIPPEKLDEFRKGMVDGMVIKRLKAGDEFTLPGGKVIKIQPEQVTADRVVLVPEGAPVPTDVHRVKGVWKVDARPIIAARRAAAAARKKAEEKAKDAGK
jgi:hypothetical protein